MAKRRLSTIAKEIQNYSEQLAAGAVEIGRRLCEAKAQLPHGEFLPWVKNNTTFNHRTASNYMRLFKEYEQLIKEKPELGVLHYSKLLELTHLNPETREIILSSYDLRTMSVREIKTVVDEVNKHAPPKKKERFSDRNILLVLDPNAAAYVDAFNAFEDTLNRMMSALTTIENPELQTELTRRTLEVVEATYLRLKEEGEA